MTWLPDALSRGPQRNSPTSELEAGGKLARANDSTTLGAQLREVSHGGYSDLPIDVTIRKPEAATYR
ncbi:MAG: hypothetical protein ABJB74_14310 [Gemmatimonas sp.]